MNPCQFCGETHGVRCPSVKAIEYHANGKMKRVEFMTPMDYRPWPAMPPVSPPTGPALPFWDPYGPGRIPFETSMGTVASGLLSQLGN